MSGYTYDDFVETLKTMVFFDSTHVTSFIRNAFPLVAIKIQNDKENYYMVKLKAGSRLVRGTDDNMKMDTNIKWLDTRDAHASYGGNLKSAALKNYINLVYEKITLSPKNRYNDICFSPRLDQKIYTYTNMYNTWRDFKCFELSGPIHPPCKGFTGYNAYSMDKYGSILDILDFIRRIVCSSDEYAYRYIIEWLSCIIKKPSNKLPTMILMHGSVNNAAGNMFWDFISNNVLGNHCTREAVMASINKDTIIDIVNQTTLVKVYNSECSDDEVSVSASVIQENITMGVVNGKHGPVKQCSYMVVPTTSCKNIKAYIDNPMCASIYGSGERCGYRESCERFNKIAMNDKVGGEFAGYLYGMPDNGFDLTILPIRGNVSITRVDVAVGGDTCME